MTIVSNIILYIIIWWTLIFAVLPWGNHPAKKIKLGHAREAPENPRLYLKFFVNSLLSAVIWYILYYVITRKLIDLEKLSIVTIKQI